MMDGLASQLARVSLRVGYFVVTRAALYAIIGIVAGLLSLLLIWPQLAALFHSANVGHAGEPANGPAAILTLIALAAVHWKPIALILLFAVVLPGTYVVLGYRHGLRRGLASVIEAQRAGLTDWLRDRIAAALAQARLPGHLDLARVRALILRAVDVASDLPRPIRRVLCFAARRANLDGVASALGAATPERAAEAAALLVGRMLDEHLGRPKHRALGIILLANAAAVVLVKLLV